MFARVPVEHLCAERAVHWQQGGFPSPNGILSMSTYVDNVYVAGKSCSAVSSILADWGLRFKASSQMVMAPLGCRVLMLRMSPSGLWLTKCMFWGIAYRTIVVLKHAFSERSRTHGKPFSQTVARAMQPGFLFLLESI